jgi:hypothetical protein
MKAGEIDVLGGITSQKRGRRAIGAHCVQGPEQFGDAIRVS